MLETTNVEKITLDDDSQYSGSAILNKGVYIPHGWGKKTFPNTNSVIGIFENGQLNGLMYNNRHNDMFMGLYDARTNGMNGWGIRMARGLLFFGVWKESNLALDLTEQVEWMLFKLNEQNYQKSYAHVYSKIGEIMLGIPGKRYEQFTSLFTGYHFMTNGDVYIGTCETGLQKTGKFIKYSFDGKIQIGKFKEGILIDKMDIQELLDDYLGIDYSDNEHANDPIMSLLTDDFQSSSNMEERRKYKHLYIDTNKKYF